MHATAQSRPRRCAAAPRSRPRTYADRRPRSSRARIPHPPVSLAFIIISSSLFRLFFLFCVIFVAIVVIVVSKNLWMAADGAPLRSRGRPERSKARVAWRTRLSSTWSVAAPACSSSALSAVLLEDLLHVGPEAPPERFPALVAQLLVVSDDLVEPTLAHTAFVAACVFDLSADVCLRPCRQCVVTVATLEAPVLHHRQDGALNQRPARRC